MIDCKVSALFSPLLINTCVLINTCEHTQGVGIREHIVHSWVMHGVRTHGGVAHGGGDTSGVPGQDFHRSRGRLNLPGPGQWMEP